MNAKSPTRRIYLDYAGATPVLPEALRSYAEASILAGNPGAIHTDGVKAAQSLARSRAAIASLVGCKPGELMFTSGGTESNNLAILGGLRAVELGIDKKIEQTHWILSAIEHPSVLECFGEVERRGGMVTFVEPDRRGLITSEALQRALRPETVFVSIGWGNGEIGIVQPITELVRTVRAHEKIHDTIVTFHTDAGQAVLYKPTLVNSLGVDLLTLDAGKLYAPRGLGVLFVRTGTTLKGTQLGGKQEAGLRAGTENVALAAGLATAYAIVAAERADEAKRLEELRRDFLAHVLQVVPDVVVNGDVRFALPHILNISIPNINSEYLVLALDHAGISLSTKSACREGEEQQSHVVAALGNDPWIARSTLRFSLGRDTTAEDLAYVVSVLAPSIEKART